MSRSGKVELDWADGRYVFQLPIAQIEELQEKCKAGPVVIFERLASHTWRIEDAREPLRLGLIGGGMDPVKARKLVDRYAGSGQLLRARDPAMEILGAALEQPPDEPLGKENGAADEAKATAPMMDASPLPDTMESVP